MSDSAAASKSTCTGEDVPSGAWRIVLVSTIAFAVDFWAWSLLAPLGPAYGRELDLTSFTKSVLVALPVVIGSVGRVPAGALTDRYGARVMFTILSLATIIPIALIAFLGNTPAMLMVGGVLLGFGGTTFAVGVPAVNAWFPARKRGTALGLFGIGTGGTAIATFTTLPLQRSLGRLTPFLLVILGLIIVAVLCWTLLREPPNKPSATGSALARSAAAMRRGVTWQLAMLYALTFGGFVAFSVYLPTYLNTAYHLGVADASARTAGFVVLAVIARPLGGALCDRVHPGSVLAVCAGVACLLALLAAFEFALAPGGTIAFLGLAVVLGAGAGAVFALVGKVVAPGEVGAVTGVVGAAGGLGGFFPPLVMGAIYGYVQQYTLGYVLLAVVAAGCAALALTMTRRASATSANAARA